MPLVFASIFSSAVCGGGFSFVDSQVSAWVWVTIPRSWQSSRDVKNWCCRVSSVPATREAISRSDSIPRARKIMQTDGKIVWDWGYCEEERDLDNFGLDK